MTVISRNPATGEILNTFRSAGPNEVKGAVALAREAQRAWGSLGLDERLRYFERLKSVFEERLSEILELVKLETGKLTPDGEAEVYDVIDAIGYYAQQARAGVGPKNFALNAEALPDTEGILEYVPFGVIGLIMPWNFPFYSPAIFSIAAVLAGNAVVIKPSEYSTMVGLKLEALFKDAGFPDGIVQTLPGADETGAALSRSEVDKLFFVGSVEAGRQVIAEAAGTPVQVELGGNSAAIVLADADVKLAVEAIAWGATYHSGQDCVAVKRIFVHDSVADTFVDALTKVVGNLRLGVDYGPYITSEARDQVADRISAAVAGGAGLLTGGEIVEPGFWLTPSVLMLSDLSPELVAKETFGNAAPIVKFRDLDEAIHLANSTSYGLSNSVFSSDEELATSVARRLESGMTFINEGLAPFPGWDHWTGWKASGFGSVEGKYAQCVKKRVITINRSGRRSFWYPY